MALRRFHNNAEVACQWLLSAGAAFATGGAQEQSGVQQPGADQEQGAAQLHGEQSVIKSYRERRGNLVTYQYQ